MKNIITLCFLIAAYQITFAQTVWKIADNPVYFATDPTSSNDGPMRMIGNQEHIRVFQNEDESITVDMVISRSGEMQHSFNVNGAYAGDSPSANWAYGNIDDYANLSYQSSWKNMHDSSNIKMKFDTQPNAVIQVLPFDIYIEYRLIAYPRDDNKGIDGDSNYFNYTTSDGNWGKSNFAHLRGGAGGEVSSDTFSFHTSTNTKYWPLDNEGYDNIRIVKNSPDDPNNPFNHDAITDGVQISRLNTRDSDNYDNGLKNPLRP